MLAFCVVGMQRASHMLCGSELQHAVCVMSHFMACVLHIMSVVGHVVCPMCSVMHP